MIIFFKPGTTIYLLFVLIIILSVDLNYWLLFFFLHEMGSLEISIFALAFTFPVIVLNIFWFRMELSLYPKFLNNGYLSEPQVNVVFQNNFLVGLDRIIQSKCISPDVEEETVLCQ